MSFIITLWMPILLSAVFVFIASSVIHMVLGYHASDFKQLPEEDKAMDTLRALHLPPGQYAMPKANSMKDFGSDTFKAKMKKGPVIFMNVRQPSMGMGKSLVLWFLYSVVVGIFTAYIGSHTLGPDADYLVVFRIMGCTAFMGYGLALFHDAIWLSRSWNATLKLVFDAFVYALLTAGTFGWLWHG